MSIAQSSRDNRWPTPDDPGPPDSPCTCAKARRTARHLTREYDRALKPAGLKLTQYSVLANLMRSGGLSITALAERLAMDRTTMTRNLRPLERSGWVVLRDGPDRRSRSVEITETGRQTYDRAMPLWQSAERAIRQAMGGDRAAELRRLLDEAISTAVIPTLDNS